MQTEIITRIALKISHINTRSPQQSLCMHHCHLAHLSITLEWRITRQTQTSNNYSAPLQLLSKDLGISN